MSHSIKIARKRGKFSLLCLMGLFVLFHAFSATAAEISPEMLKAARDGDLDTVKKLVARGEDVNATSADGVTALMVASAGNQVAVVKYLISAGADAGRQTKSGKTALFFADARGNTDVVNLLQKAITNPQRANPPVERPQQTEPPPDPTVEDDTGKSCKKSDITRTRFFISNVDDDIVVIDNTLHLDGGGVYHEKMCPGTYSFTLKTPRSGHACSGSFILRTGLSSESFDVNSSQCTIQGRRHPDFK